MLPPQLEGVICWFSMCYMGTLSAGMIFCGFRSLLVKLIFDCKYKEED